MRPHSACAFKKNGVGLLVNNGPAFAIPDTIANGKDNSVILEARNERLRIQPSTPTNSKCSPLTRPPQPGNVSFSAPQSNISSATAHNSRGRSGSKAFKFGASVIVPNLWLGSHQDAADPMELKARSMCRVVKLAVECPISDALLNDPDIAVLKINLKDDSDTDIAAHFDETCTFIHEALMGRKGVLVHCRCGVSRSSTMVIAYLMLHGSKLPDTPLSVTRLEGRIDQVSQFGRTPSNEDPQDAFSDGDEFPASPLKRIGDGCFKTFQEEDINCRSGTFQQQILSCPLADPNYILQPAFADRQGDLGINSTETSASAYDSKLSVSASSAGAHVHYAGSPLGHSRFASVASPTLDMGNSVTGIGGVVSPLMSPMGGTSTAFNKNCDAITRYKEAYEFVKSKRPQISPNLGFVLALQEIDAARGFETEDDN